MEEYASKLSATIQSVSQEHKDIHASISKYGRIIDKVRWMIPMCSLVFTIAVFV